MFARVTTFPGNHVKEGVKFLNNVDKAGLAEARGSYVLADQDNQKTMALTFWETKQALDDSMSAEEKIANQIAKDITGMPPKMDVYEVADHS